jgi:hypothetical protein
MDLIEFCFLDACFYKGGGGGGLSFGRSVILGPHFGLIYEETFGLMLVGQNCITEHMQFILGQYTVARVISVE